MEDKNQLHQPDKVQPSEDACFLSKLFYCWAPPLFYKSYRTKVSEEYYAPLRSHKSQRLGNKVESAWKKECELSTKPSLWKVLWKVFRVEFITLGLFFLFCELLLKLTQPWLIGRLMTATTQKKQENHEFYLYALLIATCNFFSVILGHFYTLKIQHLGMKVRVACCSLIYRRILSKNAAAAENVGSIINLLSNDANRFDLGPMSFWQLVVAPIETVFIIYFMYVTVGPTSIAGILLLMLFVPLQIFLGKLTMSFRRKTAQRTDQRIKLMDEILAGIQVIKTFAWEALFIEKITEARRSELLQIMKVFFIKAFNVSSMLFLNRTGIFLCIISQALAKGEVTAKYVFVVASFYAILRQILTVYFPFGMQHFGETKVAVQRISSFLKNDETKLNEQNEELQALISTELTDINDKQKGVFLQNAAIKWPNSSNYILQDANFEISGNQFAVIIGPVGAGKSSLLYTLLQELPLSEGNINVVGKISYASQDPWIFSGSIRQNILFGSEFEPKKYNEVVRICQLEKDLSTFSENDNFSVGEAGSRLSGGQKSRISLARALYKEADIYLLDNPLAAVDTKVAEKLFQECILQYLKDKCRVVVTHQCGDLVKFADKTFVLNQGKLISEDVEKINFEMNTNSDVSDDVSSFKQQQQQDQVNSSTPKKNFRRYIQATGSYTSGICLLLLFFLTQATASGADFFVAFWVNLNETEDAKKYFQLCLYIYIGIILATIVLPIIRSFLFFKKCLTASSNLHNNMFSCVIKAPMMFFKTTSTGQILNRFSKDLGLIDETLPVLLTDTIQIAFIVFGSIFLVSLINPWLLIPTAALGALLYFFKLGFLSRSRNIKRLEAEARSPIYAHTHATIQGLPTIRTFGVENILKSEFDHHQDLHNSAFYMFLTCSRAFCFWVDINGVFYSTVVIIVVMSMDTSAGNVGLSITQAINLIGLLQWGIRQWSELENQMINVERIIEYTQIPQEPDTPNEPPKNWPNKGEIQFDSVSLNYSQKDYALDNVNLLINPQEKIGIVGRTGAGKSSFTSALFRLYDTKGKILIDGINIKDISLKALRSKISLLSQDPVLFTGTLRSNIDPFNEFDDSSIWRVLENVELKKTVLKLSQNIYSEILRGGSNLSVGQRQLVCLARALLRKNKIIVMDEATANVDLETSNSIQDRLKTNFGDCTIISVAHRLNSVMESDKIVVMDDGKIVECDKPEVLLQNSQSLFAQLVNKSKEDTRL